MECKDCDYFVFDAEMGCKRCHYLDNVPESADLNDADDLFDCLDDCKSKCES